MRSDDATTGPLDRDPGGPTPADHTVALGPEDFVRSLAPFDRLDDATLRTVLAALEVTYVPAGTRVLHHGGAPSDHLHIVRKGTALVSRDEVSLTTVEPGEWFGMTSIVNDRPIDVDVDAIDDLLIYRLPATVVRELAASPAFAPEVRGLASRLRAASVDNAVRAPSVPTAPVGTLVARELVTVPPDADVGTVARTMRQERISSVVIDADPPALVTTRDLRDRVLAEGRGPDTAATAIASSPILAVDVATPIVEVRVRMLERAIHHLGVERDGRLVAVITTGDLLRADASSPSHLQQEIATAPRGNGGKVRERLYATVSRQLSGGSSPLEVTRTVSMLTDVLLRRCTEHAIEHLGPPPAPYAWLTLGSDARREQTLLTDQDHALVHGEVDDDGAAWFAAFARDVSDQLADAGLPYCAGGVMATNWAGTLPTWRARFEGWLDEPDVRALFEASIFLDNRVVAGDLDVEVLDEVVRARRGDRVLLARMAAGAGRQRPPLGLLQRVRSGADRTVDLKAGGIGPIVALARVLAVEAGTTARSTVDRLAAATANGALSADAAEELSEAFRFFQELRMHGHLRAWHQDLPASNAISLDALTPTRRRSLKDAFVAVARLQRAVITRLGGDEVEG